uniref:Ig-like domain-containing protein n=1 Tax=Ornithorhynchus anatinus TaxID=9258 RepID=F7EX51_ORNAN
MDPVSRSQPGPGLLLKVQKGCGLGPEEVASIQGESLTVMCQYNQGWERNQKWWCRGADWESCKVIVKTSRSERDNGRVSIRDRPGNRTFTVTMENVTVGDTDTYWCGIQRVEAALGARVTVTISTGKIVGMGLGGGERERNLLWPLHTHPCLTIPPSPASRSFLEDVHILILFFLKVLTLLGLVGAFIWVNKPQRARAGAGGSNLPQPAYLQQG